MRQNARTSSETVADSIRAMIFSGTLKPGVPLRQDHLSETLSVSRTPLRQALQMLSDEGLVVTTGFKGARVTEINVAMVQDLFDMRLALEPLALKSAIPLMTKLDTARAEMVLDRADTAQNDAERCALNWEFHHALYTPCQRSVLLETIKRLNVTASFATVIGRSVACRVNTSHEEHTEILALCKDNNTKRAVSALKAHLCAAHQELAASLARLEDKEA